MRPGVLRGLLVLAIAGGGLAATTADATASHSVVERVSTAPSGGNGEFFTDFKAATPDGSHVFFETTEALVAEDDDGGQIDVYVRHDGTTELVSVSRPGTVEQSEAFFLGVSDDGSRAFYETEERVSTEDLDAANDVYERSAGQTTLLTPSPEGAVVDEAPFYEDASADGTRVFFSTSEQLTDGDENDAFDIYLSEGGEITRLTSGPTGGDFDAVSEDGSVLVFESGDQLSDDDTDATWDLYRLAGGVTTLLSIGPAGGNDGPGFFEFGGLSSDGTRTYFLTPEALVDDDVDSFDDVYLNTPGGTVLVSADTDAEVELDTANADLGTVLFRTDSAALPEDTDFDEDLYAWHDGDVALVSTGPVDSELLFVEGEFVSADGSRILFSTDAQLTADDTDAERSSVYERTGGQTHLLTPGTIDDDALFQAATADAGGVFFVANERLAATDLDDAQDIYETAGGVTTQVSRGNGAFDAEFGAISTDGGRVVWATDEQVTPDDTDTVNDVYVSAVSAVAPPQNTVPPAITGTPASGQTLTCSPGTWVGAESFAYQWNRGGVPIPGATSATYAVTGLDQGKQITCTVTATGDGGSATATSAAVTAPGASGGGGGGVGPPPGACANIQTGGAGPDILLGTAFGDRLAGLGGADNLRGLDGADCLVGGPGRDLLAGGRGVDLLQGSGGKDRLLGGARADVLRGGAGDDVIRGGKGTDKVFGGAGDDVVGARDHHAETIRCGRGVDEVTADLSDKLVSCELVFL